MHVLTATLRSHTVVKRCSDSSATVQAVQGRDNNCMCACAVAFLCRSPCSQVIAHGGVELKGGDSFQRNDRTYSITSTSASKWERHTSDAATMLAGHAMACVGAECYLTGGVALDDGTYTELLRPDLLSFQHSVFSSTDPSSGAFTRVTSFFRRTRDAATGTLSAPVSTGIPFADRAFHNVVVFQVRPTTAGV